METPDTQPIPRPVFLRDAAEVMTRHCCTLLGLAGDEITPRSVLAMVQSLPHDPAEISGERWTSGFCNRCLAKAHQVNPVECEPLVEHLAFYFPSLPPAGQLLLVDAFDGILRTLSSFQERT